MYDKIVFRDWFESIIMFCILMIGAATGVDLEFNGGEDDPGVRVFLGLVAEVTFWAFSAECLLKIVAEAYHPWTYFTDAENGAWNSFDFVIVTAGWVFRVGIIDSSQGGALPALRMLRLVRLLTFVKGVPMLRGIIQGIGSGLKSVSYIVLLLFLIM